MSQAEISKELAKMQKLFSLIEESAKSFDCLFTHCSNYSIKSHSISESKILFELTGNREEKLFSIEDKPQVDHRAKKFSSFQFKNRTLEQKYIASSSTFYGFCKECDFEAFELLDNEVYRNTSNINFLHALRAHGYKLVTDKKEFHFIKNDLLALISKVSSKLNEVDDPIQVIINQMDKMPAGTMITREVGAIFEKELKKNMSKLEVYRQDKNNPYYKSIIEKSFKPDEFDMPVEKFKVRMREIITKVENVKGYWKKSGVMKELEDFEEYVEAVLSHQTETIEKLSKAYRDENYSDFEFLHYSIQGFFPIAGNFIYSTPENQEVSLTFFPETETNTTHFIFSIWEPNEQSTIYLSKINCLEPSKFKFSVSSIILSQGTNTHFSKQYFESLGEEEKEILSKVKVIKAFPNFNLFSDDQMKIKS